MQSKNDHNCILVADDDALIRSNLAKLLRSEGYEAIEAADGLQAAALFEDPRISLALLDLNMPGRNGMEILRENPGHLDDTPVIVITAYGGSGPAIEAMKLGAFDYIAKPFDLDEVLLAVRRALAQRSLVLQVRSMNRERTLRWEESADDELVGRSPAMLEIFKMIGRVAVTHEPVLIMGESGTGKELVANAIHRSSRRSSGPFVKVNSAALSSTLLESELFGHERGAFTGAVAQHRGRFEQANQGTLFLDEIGDMDVDLQAKLLRVLQTGQFERVGGSDVIQTDVRVISATNRDLSARIAEGSFREDLFYRLNVVSIQLPPLRGRRSDIPLIADHLVRRLSQKYNWSELALSSEASRCLAELPWIGNVRELQNVLARAAILSRGQIIAVEALKIDQLPPTAASAVANGSLNLKVILCETERRVIAQALEQEGWNRTKAAEALGISRRQLFDKIQQYGFHE